LSKKLGFVRDATGLVRELSFFDAFAVNFVAPSATVGFIITTWTLWLLPGANAPLGIILTGLVGMVTIALIYSLFAASMPRSGGDYVYISRGLHPALGFAGNFAQFYMEMLILGGSAIYTQSYLTNGFVSTGLVANNPGLVDIGVALGTPVNTFIVGTITIVAFALISIWSTKKLMRIIAVLFVANLIGIFVSIGALAFFDPSKFVGLFNGLM
jgi:APA family basic amino acid/polyamine antiporter